MSQIDLSVAIIFKNEIRCLERCLKSLQPLRERLSLQIVMADTGATDGSRAVAERYADVLFDFPWINDFAAARNATLERCAGRWTLVVDCDEWLDGDVSELVEHMRGKASEKQDIAVLIQRNYTTEELVEYMDFRTGRLLNMASLPHYEGAIHETPVFENRRGKGRVLTHTILHHDGYIMLNNGSDEGKKKNERNRALLRADLARDPDDIRTLSLFLDCSKEEPDYLEKLRHAVSLIKARHAGWETFGPRVLVVSVFDAVRLELPEEEAWSKLAFSMFPDSFYTQIDLNFQLCVRAHDLERYEDAVRYGRAYLKADAEYDMNLKAALESQYGQLMRRGETWSALIGVCTADALRRLLRYDETFAIVKDLDGAAMDGEEARATLLLLEVLYEFGGFDTAPLLRRFWERLHLDTPNRAWRERREQAFYITGMVIFDANPSDLNGRKPRDLFLPLAGASILGDAAALMHCTEQTAADELLAGIETPEQLPAAAFVRALKLGAEFPVPGRALDAEQMAALAQKLRIDPPFLREAASFAAGAAQTEQELLWAYALAKTALDDATAAVLGDKGVSEPSREEKA